MKELCEKHGMDIVSYRGHEPYCDECHVEDIILLMKGHSEETIARWIYLNAELNNDTWPSNEDNQMYTLDMLKHVISFGHGFYQSEIFDEAMKRLDEMQGD